MSAVTGTFRNGKIELHGPPPADWVDGTEVSVSPLPTQGEIDFWLRRPPDKQPREPHLEDDDVAACLFPDLEVWSEYAAHERLASDIDLTGDSPEAIAAWIEWMEEQRVLAAESPEADDELQRILAERKAELKAMWGQQVKRVEGLFP